MRIVAYSYIEPLIDSIPDPQIWGWEIEEIYQDIDTREKLNQLFIDSQDNAPDYLLINSLHELGNSLTEVENNIFKLESLNIEIISLQQDYHSKNFHNVTSIQQKKRIIKNLAGNRKFN